MNTVYNARNPAPGVVVLGFPGSRAQGLPLSLARNARQDDENISWHVLKPTRRCEPTGLGLPSTVKTIPHHVLSIPGCAPQTVRPASRRRGHCHRPQNMGFSARPIPQAHYDQREADRAFSRLRTMHTKVVTCVPMVAVEIEGRYESARKHALFSIRRLGVQLADSLEARLDAMELDHNKSL